jgi:hypothetical protein
MEFEHLYKITSIRPLILVLLLAGCRGSSGPDASANPPPLSARNLNLIFVVSEDLAFHASGDVDPDTANLTNQGLQRSLKIATFMRRRVLGGKNVTGVYALEPMTHLQTASDHPDIAALETIQQFALLNKITVTGAGQTSTGNSFPINASYASPVPSGVATPTISCPNCQGLDFADQGSDNEALVTGIITANVPGFHVFSAPWETTRVLLASINNTEGYNLTLPATYAGPNYIFAISIAPSGSARLVSFNTHLNPRSTYPALPSPVPVTTSCIAQPPFPTIRVTGGNGGAVVPAGINTNQTMYLIRHADAHPVSTFGDGNYVCAGQWRALDLPYVLANALRGKISPQQVYSIDPAQITPGSTSASGNSDWSDVAPALTAEPYAIANSLPYDLVTSFQISDSNSGNLASTFFFNDGQFSNRTVLLAWHFQQIAPTVNALLGSYFAGGVAPNPAPDWPSTDYDSIWTVTLDASGNVTVDNSTCEGIDSATLPATCPQF